MDKPRYEAGIRRRSGSRADRKELIRVDSDSKLSSKWGYPEITSQSEPVLLDWTGRRQILASDVARPVEIETTFETFEDGMILDLVRDPCDSRHVQFLAAKGSDCCVRDSFYHHGLKYVIPQAAERILQHLMLPTGLADLATAGELACKIRRLICSCVAIRRPYRFLVAAFVLYSWLADQLPGSVYLFIAGLPVSGKTTLLEVLRLLCRRSLFTGDVSAAGMTEACSSLLPTLLIDEAEFDGRSSSRALRRLLRSGTNRQEIVLRKGSSGTTYGPKVLCCEDVPNDEALASRCLVIPMVTGDTIGLQKPSDPEIVNLANQLQNQLLAFRLDRMGEVRPVVVPGSGRLDPRQRDLLSYLAAPFVADPDWLGLLLNGFETTCQVSSPSLSPDCALVLDALWGIMHVIQPCQLIFISTFADGLRKTVKSKGWKINVNPVAIGQILTKLGIRSRVHTRQGNGLWINEQNLRRVHELMAKYGLTNSEFHVEIPGRAPCAFCQEFERKEKAMQTR